MFFNFGAGAARVRERIEHEDSGGAHESLHVPHLLDVEVLNVLRRYHLRVVLSPTRASLSLRRLSGMRLVRYPHASLVARIWELRGNLIAYDAAYVALAEALDAPLVTTDGRLARSPGHRARVELYS